MLLLAFAGQVESGKSAAAEYLQEHWNIVCDQFATPVYEKVAELFQVEIAYLHDRKHKDIPNEKITINNINGDEAFKTFALLQGIDPDEALTARKALILYGYDYVRKQLGNETNTVDYAQSVFDSLAEIGEVAGVAFSGIRDETEVDFMDRNGGHIIHIVNPGLGEKEHASTKQHHSSQALPIRDCDIVIQHSGYFEQFYADLNQAMVVIAGQEGVRKMRFGF